jgi:hypothetical protein
VVAATVAWWWRAVVAARSLWFSFFIFFRNFCRALEKMHSKGLVCRAFYPPRTVKYFLPLPHLDKPNIIIFRKCCCAHKRKRTTN